MHPLLDAEIARERIEGRRARAEHRRVTGRRRRERGAALRVEVGSRLIAVGCRLFLSGYATSVATDGSQAARSARRLSLEKTSTIG
jgi:hypothetical protein